MLIYLGRLVWQSNTRWRRSLCWAVISRTLFPTSSCAISKVSKVTLHFPAISTWIVLWSTKHIKHHGFSGSQMTDDLVSVISSILRHQNRRCFEVEAFKEEYDVQIAFNSCKKSTSNSRFLYWNVQGVIVNQCYNFYSFILLLAGILFLWISCFLSHSSIRVVNMRQAGGVRMSGSETAFSNFDKCRERKWLVTSYLV